MSYHPNMGVTREYYDEINRRPDYVGKIGERRTIRAKIVTVAGAMTDWGYKFFVTLKDGDGNLYRYAGSVDLGYMKQTVTILATIKNHKLINGKRMTVIARPKKKVKKE